MIIRFNLSDLLTILALGYTFVLFFSPFFLSGFYWRISRRTGGMLKTLDFLCPHSQQMAKQAPPSTDPLAKPKISF